MSEPQWLTLEKLRAEVAYQKRARKREREFIMTKDERELFRRARMIFVLHLCEDGVPYGSEQDPSITCLACEMDKLLRDTFEPGKS